MQHFTRCTRLPGGAKSVFSVFLPLFVMEQEQWHDTKRQKSNEENTAKYDTILFIFIISNFVVTEEARRVLALLETSLGADFPVLLEGHGTSTIFMHFAKMHQMSLNILCTAEQTDCKTLLGSLVPSTGKGLGFEWRSGVVVQAMLSGEWLLLRDLHSATPEILAILRPLLESHNRGIYVPGLGRYVKAQPGFRIFGTSHGSSHVFDSASKPLWYVISVRAPLWQDMKSIADAQYPLVGRFWPWLHHFQDMSLRSLLKLCSRLNYRSSDSSLNSVDQMSFVQAVFDVLVAAHPSPDQVEQSAALVSLSPEIALKLAFDHVIPSGRVLGRARISTDHFPRTLALTRVSSQLLERIAMAVNLNEPVLLVGETGTGKTTLIQHLTTLLGGHELHVINMSQQSEASDLLGGLKPFSLPAIAKVSVRAL